MLTCYRPQAADTSDAWGWERDRRIRAERVRVASRSLTEGGEAWADYTVRFRVRCAHPVREGWRVEERSGYLYQVINMEPDRALGYNTLVCERVNT